MRRRPDSLGVKHFASVESVNSLDVLRMDSG
jgi:hypothetical protein